MDTQLALFHRSAAPGWDHRFSGLRQRDLGDGAWVAHQAGWLQGHQALFDHLHATTDWQHRTREMYGQTVDVPRLVARIPEHGPGHPLLTELAQALICRTGRCLTSVSLALYRDGRDSVAPHGDRVGPDAIADSVIAILSLGVPRRFRLQPIGKGRSIDYTLGWGDLLLMGGACQRAWRHGVPKARRTSGPRMSVMFREPRPEPTA